MKFRLLMASGLAAMMFVAACAHRPPVAKAPTPPPDTTPPVSVTLMAPSAPPPSPAPAITTPSVYVPDVSHANGPLPDNILVWDAVLKSLDVTNGLDFAKFAFSFTNVTASPVTILDAHPSCGCTTAEMPPRPWTIPAGTGGEIKIKVNLQGKTGTLFKYVTINTDKGTKNLNMRINILPEPVVPMTDADIENGIQAARADRQAVFHGDCAKCHNKDLAGKYAEPLFAAACAICHEATHRASMVPDLKHLTVPTNVEFWRTWITSGKPGSLMPAFATSQGGPLNDIQIASLAQYLNAMNPSKVPLPPPAH
jgi:mono/diheme cytochrome c family protein